MSTRLVKIAKELNVGTSTIVDFLSKNGHVIENKPTAKVSDELHDLLIKEFSNSIAVKEKADLLIIGRNQGKEEAPEKSRLSTPVRDTKPAVSIDSKKEVKKESEVNEEVPAVTKTEDIPVEKPAEKEEKPAKKEGPKLKVLGKIDLDALKSKPAEKSKEQPKKDTKKEEVQDQKENVEKETPKETPSTPPKTPDTAKEGENRSDKESDADATEAPPKQEILRAKTPKLQGLKILGKVDKSKLETPKKTKEPTAPKKKAASNQESGRRKRTRKKVTANNYVNKRHGDRGKKQGARAEVKEVTQKEIDDKIKATMARLSGKGKNKRQKIRRDSRETKREKQEILDAENVEKTLKLTEFISVSELAGLMDVSVTEVITTCMNLGVIVSINQRLDAEIIELVAGEFGHEVEFINAEEQDTEEEIIEDDPKDLEPRAPIVTVMGHVDHGKTSLLDYIREANVVAGEAGGITQHIGAYEVRVGPDNKKITFLDTPGHEAFTAMRARGAKVTDVAVIIIAADDKIMPQTKEAISHAQAAGVPIVFAINKIDKEGASPDRIKQELSSMNLLVEEWGGSYQSQDISAKQGLNIDLLLEKILLEAEVLELKANPSRQAIGTVIEASLDKGKGYVTKILVQNGTLKVGNSTVAGAHSGKIKAMYNERGKRIKEAGPSTPVLVLGLSGAPQAGEKFKVMSSDQEARQLATKRSQIEREQTNRAIKRISLDEIGRRLALGTFKELNLIIKGDVDGSIEALADSLIKLSVETIQVNVIHKAVGQIIESDVLLASASDAIIIGFQVRPSSDARHLAEKEGVQIKTYSIIYEAIEEIKSAMEGMLEPTEEEKIMGQAEVRETYKISKVGTVAGCYVTEGRVTRNANIRLVRNGIVVYPQKEGAVGEISSLKRFKDDAKEVKNGHECGITIKGFNDVKVGDIIEAFEIIEVKQRLE